MPSRTSRPDHVGESQRAHRVLVAERHRRVDVLGRGDAVLDHADRLEAERDAEPEEAKPGASVDDDRGLADRAAPTRGPRSTSAPSVASPRTISTSVDAGTGLKKCRPRKRAGRSSSAGELVDRDRRGVRRERGVPGDHGLDAGERVDLQLEVLGHGLDDEPRPAKSSTSVATAKRAAIVGLVVVGGAAGDGCRDGLDTRPRPRRRPRRARRPVTREPAIRKACAMPAPMRRRRARRRRWGARWGLVSLTSLPSRGTRSCGGTSRGSRTARPAPRGRPRGCASRGAEHALGRDGRGAVVAGDAVGDRVGRGEQLVGRDAARGDEPDLERLGGADGAPGEQQLDGARLADDLLQAPARPGGGDDAEARSRGCRSSARASRSGCRRRTPARRRRRARSRRGRRSRASAASRCARKRWR